VPVLVQPPLAVHCNARLSQSLQQQEPSSTVSERDGEPLLLLLEALGRTTSSRRRSLVLALCCQLFSHLSRERSSGHERKRSTNELHKVTHGPPPPPSPPRARSAGPLAHRAPPSLGLELLRLVHLLEAVLVGADVVVPASERWDQSLLGVERGLSERGRTGRPARGEVREGVQAVDTAPLARR